MAETKQAKKAQAKSKPKARASKPRKSASKPKAKARSASKPKAAASKPAPSKPQAALEAVGETAKDAGGAVGRAAGKAKVPLMAGGAALAGAAGGIALGAHQAHRRNGLAGVSSKDLAKAVKKVGDVGAQVGEVALEVRRARQATNGNGHAHRSPIEVVLQGLTSRAAGG
jgi:hypothetical protein